MKDDFSSATQETRSPTSIGAVSLEVRSDVDADAPGGIAYSGTIRVEVLDQNGATMQTRKIDAKKLPASPQQTMKGLIDAIRTKAGDILT